MATQERAGITNGIVRKLGIVALSASVTVAACGTSGALSGVVETRSERQSVLGDPENPYWSHNSATSTADEAAVRPQPGRY